jgi:hypothetical protein
MDPHSEQELLTAIFNKDVATYEALIQNASVINNNVLLNIVVIAFNMDAFRAVLKHSSIDPFFNDNSLIHVIINHNFPIEFLAAVLEHPANHLTADHYHAFLSACGSSKDKQDLLHAYLNKQ